MVSNSDEAQLSPGWKLHVFILIMEGEGAGCRVQMIQSRRWIVLSGRHTC